MSHAPSQAMRAAAPASERGARQAARPPVQRRPYSPQRRRRAAARRRRLRGLLRLAVLVAVVLVAVWASVHVANAGSETGQFDQRTCTVQAGDTLWSIAVRSYGADIDPRKAVWAIERANGLRGAELVPGQTLVLPGAQSL